MSPKELCKSLAKTVTEKIRNIYLVVIILNDFIGGILKN